MALTLSGMADSMRMAAQLSSGASTAASSSSAAGSSSAVGKALETAGNRLTQQIGKLEAQVSTLGKVKSGFASVETSGKALSALNDKSSVSDVKAAAQKFVDSVNNTAKVTGDATGRATASLSGDSNTRAASTSLRLAVNNRETSDALKKVGISVASNGQMKIDSKAMDAALKKDPNAVKDALAKVGGQVSKVATRELSGNLGSAATSLVQQAKSLDAQQNSYRNAVSSLQQTATTGYASTSSNPLAGIAAYQSMFRMS